MMNQHTRFNNVTFLFLLLALLMIAPTTAFSHPQANGVNTVSSQSAADAGSGGQSVAIAFELLGSVVFETGFRFADTEVGGLSGITYDAQRGVYYVLSDDRSEVNLARYYTVDINLADGQLNVGDVTFQEVTTLLNERRNPFPERGVDPEDIVLARPGFLYISSEGSTNAEPPLYPFVNRFNLNGKQTAALSIPAKFLPSAERTSGVRNNLAFESLTVTPNGQFLYTATENALLQDGPPAAVGQDTLCRILRLGLSPAGPLEEYVYITRPVPVPPDPPGSFADNGLVALLALDDDGTLLAMERSFAVGVGNTIKLFVVSTQGATDVSGMDDLFDEDTGTPGDFVPVTKQLVLDLADLGVDPDNIEGMTFGPNLPDGRQTLILVSDNNFNPVQETQFIDLAVELATASEK